MYAPSQWETMLQCNVVAHWLGAYTKWSLHLRHGFLIPWFFQLWSPIWFWNMLKYNWVMCLFVSICRQIHFIPERPVLALLSWFSVNIIVNWQQLWFMIGWWHSYQPIRSHVRKWQFAISDFKFELDTVTPIHGFNMGATPLCSCVPSKAFLS